MRATARAPLALAALKLGVGLWALRAGFTHISDDDYARVTIAQAFAHAPRLDPSGTSWLPFPFWLNGGVMMALGRSLAVARAVAVGSGVAGALLVWRSLLRAGVRPWAAWCGVVVAMATPWSTWLGVATVPEALTASLVVVGALSVASQGGRMVGAVALLAASLSRYEAWPVAAVFALGCFATKADGGQSPWRGRALPGLLALAGPAAWILWNAHAHGDPLHFLARVAAYRLRLTGGAGSASVWALYPAAFLRGGPLTLALAACGAPGLLVDGELRRRWAWPMASVAALVAFLIEGDLHNGAPTHHPERALLAALWVAAAFGVDGVRSLAVRFVWARPKREAWLVGGVTTLAVAWGLVWPLRVADYPARSESEDRALQVARGEALRHRGAAAITVTPCAYEHFALIAAFEAPERVTVRPVAPDALRPVTADCPSVEER